MRLDSYQGRTRSQTVCKGGHVRRGTWLNPKRGQVETHGPGRHVSGGSGPLFGDVPLDPARAGITALPHELCLFAAPFHSNPTSKAACACFLRRAGTSRARHVG